MEKYPGFKNCDENPLRLRQKLWYMSECQKYLAGQTPSESYTQRNIALNLFTFQRQG